MYQVVVLLNSSNEREIASTRADIMKGRKKRNKNFWKWSRKAIFEWFLCTACVNTMVFGSHHEQLSLLLLLLLSIFEWLMDERKGKFSHFTFWG